MSKRKDYDLPEGEEEYVEERRRLGAGRVIARVLLCLFTLILIAAAAAYGMMWVIMKGPSEAAKKMFTLSARETSAVKWLPSLFISDDEIAAIVRESEEHQDAAAATDASLITIAKDNDEDPGVNGGIIIEELKNGKYKGYMMIVSDPERVFVGTPGDYNASTVGVTLIDLVDKYGATAGINAGGFDDPGGGGNGGTPLGIVINDGEILYDGGGSYSTMGFDKSGVLHVGSMSSASLEELDLRCAVSFGPALVVNGEICEGLGGGVNPRTAIGQRADGAVLMLVIDGRQIDSLGADYQDVAEIMVSYGAVNAGNLDGGSSTMMIYNGEVLNTCASVLGPRKLPTAFLVK